MITMSPDDLPTLCCKNVATNGPFKSCEKVATHWYLHNGDVCSYCDEHDYVCGEPIKRVKVMNPFRAIRNFFQELSSLYEYSAYGQFGESPPVKRKKGQMKKYLFLVAWFESSEGAGGDPTGVHRQDDLLPEYCKGNEHVFALRIEAINEEVASKYGYAAAFHKNYTGYDSTSNIFEIDGVEVPDNEETPLESMNCAVE